MTATHCPITTNLNHYLARQGHNWTMDLLAEQRAGEIVMDDDFLLDHFGDLPTDVQLNAIRLAMGNSRIAELMFGLAKTEANREDREGKTYYA